MKIEKTPIEDLLCLTPSSFEDSRGFFIENYRIETYEQYSIPTMLQWNHSRSTQGVLRGIHIQYPHCQGKLVYVPRGAIYDVAIDLRPNSSTYGKSFGVELNDSNHKQLWIPEGFGHAFYTLSEIADVLYGCTEYYLHTEQCSIRFDDPILNIDWSCVTTCHLSDKDKNAPQLKDTLFHNNML